MVRFFHSTSMDPIHPIEVTVQQLLEDPLQSLNLNLTSLYESQLILSKMLAKLHETIAEAVSNLESPASEEYLNRLEILEVKLNSVTSILDNVDDRLYKIENL